MIAFNKREGDSESIDLPLIARMNGDRTIDELCKPKEYVFFYPKGTELVAFERPVVGKNTLKDLICVQVMVQ